MKLKLVLLGLWLGIGSSAPAGDWITLPARCHGQGWNAREAHARCKAHCNAVWEQLRRQGGTGRTWVSGCIGNGITESCRQSVGMGERTWVCVGGIHPL